MNRKWRKGFEEALSRIQMEINFTSFYQTQREREREREREKIHAIQLSEWAFVVVADERGWEKRETFGRTGRAVSFTEKKKKKAEKRKKREKGKKK